MTDSTTGLMRCSRAGTPNNLRDVRVHSYELSATAVSVWDAAVKRRDA